MDVQSVIDQLNALNIDPLVSGPLIQRLHTEGLTDSVRAELEHVLTDAYKATDFELGMLETADQAAQDANKQAGAEINASYDKLEQQLDEDGTQIEQSVAPVVADLPAGPTDSPSVQPVAAPTEPAASVAPTEVAAMSAPESVPVQPLVAPAMPPTNDGGQTISAAPLANEPITQPPAAPAAGDSDWLKLLEDLEKPATPATPLASDPPAMQGTSGYGGGQSPEQSGGPATPATPTTTATPVNSASAPAQPTAQPAPQGAPATPLTTPQA